MLGTMQGPQSQRGSKNELRQGQQNCGTLRSNPGPNAQVCESLR